MSTAVRKVCSIAATSALATFTYGAAQAADLGGNCCADLEERVAELEATTARKGNRKVSLTVSGHVHEAFFYFDVDGDDATANESNVYIGTHNSSRSRFRFRGNAKINADWEAGFYMEFGVRRNGLNATSQDNPRETQGIDIRHEALYVKSKTLGTIWLGWTGSAIEGITEICLGCGIGNASPDYSFTVNNLLATRDIFGFGINGSFRSFGSASGFFPGEGDRRNMVKWISPTLAGFSLSTSWGGDDFWDAALRYAGEFGSIRLAAGIGYSASTNSVDDEGISTIGCANPNGDSKCTTLGISGSVMHVPSGIYVRGSWGQNRREHDLSINVLDLANGQVVNVQDNQDTDEGWEVTAGISQKWNSLGKTNIWAVYGESERTIGLGPTFLYPAANAVGIAPVGAVSAEASLKTYGLGIEQKVDAAAMDIYVWWRHFEADASTTDATATLRTESEADVITAGARIKF